MSNVLIIPLFLFVPVTRTTDKYIGTFKYLFAKFIPKGLAKQVDKPRTSDRTSSLTRGGAKKVTQQRKHNKDH